MQNQASLTALMSAFARAFHAENELHPVFRDDLARALLTDEEYTALQEHILHGASFLAPDLTAEAHEPLALLRASTRRPRRSSRGLA